MLFLGSPKTALTPRSGTGAEPEGIRPIPGDSEEEAVLPGTAWRGYLQTFRPAARSHGGVSAEGVEMKGIPVPTAPKKESTLLSKAAESLALSHPPTAPRCGSPSVQPRPRLAYSGRLNGPTCRLSTSCVRAVTIKRTSFSQIRLRGCRTRTELGEAEVLSVGLEA